MSMADVLQASLEDDALSLHVKRRRAAGKPRRRASGIQGELSLLAFWQAPRDGLMFSAAC
jgi:hypothetical protein